MQPLKLGIVGAGFIAKFQVQALAQIRSVEVTGIVSRTRAHAEALAHMARSCHVGDPAVYDSIAAMAPHIDASPLRTNYMRAEMVEEIVEAVRRMPRSGHHLREAAGAT